MNSVLLDTSFLITLSTPSRAHHETAKMYYKQFMARGVTMYLSTIVISEYEVRQSVRDLGLSNFIVLPFNFDDALVSGRVLTPLFGAIAEGDDRVAVKDDAKLIGQCIIGGIEHFATDDNKCAKRLKKLKDSKVVASIPFAIDVQYSFSSDWFEAQNQGSLLD